jgi:hypothetical protein
MLITILHVWVKSHYSIKDRTYKHDLNHSADILASKHLTSQYHYTAYSREDFLM